MPIRVLVELPSLLRETVRAAFDPKSDVVVGEADSGDQAVEEARRLSPDIVFIDVRMPDMDGIAVIEAIRGASPSAKVILFMEASGARIPEAIRAGVSGYLLEDTSTEDLVHAVRLALREKTLVDPRLVRPLLEAVKGTGEPDEGPHLSRRDRAILQKVSSGEPIEEIGQQLELSPRTVRIRLKRIFETLAASGPPDPPQASA
jgi:DNA-binding NarL/FixJ family response regulator